MEERCAVNGVAMHDTVNDGVNILQSNKQTLTIKSLISMITNYCK